MNMGGAVLTDCAITGNGGGISGWTGSLTRCTVEDNGSGITFEASETGGIASLGIHNCLITGNGSGVLIGAALEGSGSLGVEDSIIADNGEAGIRIDMYSSATVSRTTIAGHTSYGIRAAAGNATAANCIIWDNGDDLYFATTTYSDIEDGDAGTGNISEDPRFADSALRNYHVLHDSPCIDSGTPQASSTDFEGDARPLDGDFSGAAEQDMGGDEYNPATMDSDGDGYTDYMEIRSGSNPENADDRPAVICVNFQPAASPVPAGYGGSPYPGQGLGSGWK
jgi:hypothetical protein